MLDHLGERLLRYRRFVAAGRILLVSVALMVVVANNPPNPVPIFCLAGYAVMLLAARRAGSTTIQRLILVADVLYVPTIVSTHLPAGLWTAVLMTAVGSWITVCALDGDSRKTIARIVAFMAFTLLAVTTFEATAIDAILASALAVVAYKTAGVQQHRLLGQTIKSVEQIQQTLAMRPRHVETRSPAT